MKQKITTFAFSAMLLALSFPADAQQPSKFPRIGYLTGATPDGQLDRIEAFRQGLRELGYVEGKDIVIEWRSAEGKLDRLPALAAEQVRLKADCYDWSDTNPRRQGSNGYDSYCHDAGSRSCCQRVRRQPCATRWEHHWIVNPCPGDKRKTTRAVERDRSQVLARGRPVDVIQPGQRASVKRDGARRRGVRGEASIPRHIRSQGYSDCIPSRKQGAC